MNAGKKKWNKNFKEMRTMRNHFRIRDTREFVNKIENDPDSIRRLDIQNCKTCHYSTRMAGQAFTDSECGFCDNMMTFSNTDTDMLCQRCATMNEACKHCGGEMD